MPNQNKNWRARISPTKKLKSDCYYAAVEAKVKPLFMTHMRAKSFKLSVVFYVQKRKGRKPDVDNLNAAMKAGYDGLAMALGVDDAKFSFDEIIRAECDGPSYVLLTLRAA